MKPGYLKERRKNALSRLEFQLKNNKKKIFNEKGEVEEVALEEAEVKRIKKEIETLRTKI